MPTPEEPAEYGLVLPFVVCKSEGGPYDDESFVAGFQAGKLYAALDGLAALGVTELQATVASDLVRQIDLIAMHHGFSVAAEPCEEAEGWTYLTIRRSS